MTQLKTPMPRRPRRPRMTYEQFLQWDGDNQHVEWVDGEVVEMPPISGPHNLVGHFLLHVLDLFVQAHRLGGIRSDPFQMKTAPDLPGRAPDILFVAKSNLRRLHRTFLEGPADLAVEIISPDSRAIDEVEKFREYERGGVREYWLIDPERRHAEFYRRGRDRLFHRIPVGDDGVLRSTVVKRFWLKVSRLWELPPVLDVLKQLELV